MADKTGPVRGVEVHHRAEDLRDKGLEHGAVNVFASVVLGVASVAPAYALTATLGPTVSEVGLQMPAVFLAGFIPMLLVAYGYRGANKVMPDNGTSFTWTTRPSARTSDGCAGGGLVIATVIVLSNLAGVAVTFFSVLLGELFDDAAIAAFSGDFGWSTSSPVWRSSRSPR